MIRIAAIQRFLPEQSRGGVGHFTHGLCNALQRRGHDVTVFTQDPAPRDALYHVTRLPATRPVLKFASAPWTFAFQISKQNFSEFDIIHAQGDDHLIPRSAPPIVRTMHGSALAEAIYNGWQPRLAKRFFMHLYFYGCELISAVRADALVVVSRDTARYYPKVHDVISNGIDLNHFQRENGAKSDHPTILFVGELNTRKRGKLLLEVFWQEIRHNLPEAELWLVCPERVEGEGVRWFFAVSSEELARLYTQAWVFCLPSSYEGFGRPYIEALAAGTPVIATSNPGAREVLDDGRFGLIVPGEQLGQTLCHILTDRALREKFRELGIKRAKDYSWEKVARQYERVYHALLEARASSLRDATSRVS